MIKLLCVEDSSTYREILQVILPKNVEWNFAENLQQANDLIASTEFDVVLLDLNLPDGDSLGLCCTIREQEKAADRVVTIIFLSSEESLQWRLRAYDHGADSCLSKHIIADELEASLNALIKYHQKRTLTFHDPKERDFNKLENSLFHTTNDYSAVLTFFRALAGIYTLAEVMEKLNHLMACWDLSFVVQLNGDDAPYIYKQFGQPISPLEETIFEMLREAGTGVQNFGHHSYFCYLDMELLLGNMPEDSETSGRLRDLFHMVAEIIYVKVKDIYAMDSMELGLHSLRNELLGDDSVNKTALNKVDRLLQTMTDGRISAPVDTGEEITFF